MFVQVGTHCKRSSTTTPVPVIVKSCTLPFEGEYLGGNLLFYRVTRATIEYLLPNCTQITNSVYIGNDTDLTVQELTDLFGKVEVIQGALQVENTNLENIGFFSNLKNITGDSCEYRHKYCTNLRVLLQGIL